MPMKQKDCRSVQLALQAQQILDENENEESCPLTTVIRDTSSSGRYDKRLRVLRAVIIVECSRLCQARQELEVGTWRWGSGGGDIWDDCVVALVFPMSVFVVFFYFFFLKGNTEALVGCIFF